MKKIVLINGHPNPDSFNMALAAAYKEGAQQTNAEVKEIVIGNLNFNPNLQFGYKKRMDWEPDLVNAWEKIQWADYLVWIHPVWWDKLLSGKSAHIITTLDQPGWYYWLFYGRPSVNQLKKTTLEFCGIKPVKVTYFGIVKTSEEKKRLQWLNKAKQLGQKQK